MSRRAGTLIFPKANGHSAPISKLRAVLDFQVEALRLSH